FALRENDESEPVIIGEEVPQTLGDIVVSLETTQRQAEQYGHTFIRELGFLTVHGFLHLCGYDHGTEPEEKLMFTKQKELLNDYGLTK
ncbi:MAG TPA: rRNA maturation RNase YbeY, partial [Bacillales bacterium]|nr:rRNA maturation RNase YbeY [Bacillales bacterium]